jgi:hypothetical protein
LITCAALVLSLVAAGAVLNPAKLTENLVQGVVAGMTGEKPARAEARHFAPVWPSPKPAAPTKARSTYFPTPGYEESSTRLLPRVSVKVSSDSYKFLPGGTGGQAFIAYDPCRPVHYVVRAANAPAGGLELIKAGFAGLSRATGLKFVYDGPTKEAPSTTRKPFQPGMYGDRWAPVLVAWTTVKEYPEMAPRQTAEGTQWKLGEAGSGSMTAADGSQVYVTGQLALNAQALAETAAYEGQPAVYSETIAHELAHLVGEDHVNDPEQLMYPVRNGHVTGYAAGDLSGLTRLGRGPCAPEL